MEKNEVIIDVGAEGDELTLYGLRSAEGWVFSRRVIANSTERIYEARIQRTSQVVDTWPAALSLLDQYPWQHLYPIDVHPEFRRKVFDAVVERFKSDVEKNPRRLADWTNVCVTAEFSSLVN
ncbi:hypothetical protein [Rhodoferax sp.]|uniref:hypothetical protein n=1 Tax=Rhodoferax sp. TaxID=50421 RepID=UPI00262AD393|nr:hypothetical protein [Rhodoferax sp.]MDD2811235.1 hypothetical protein [Rhodoferax sp.]